MDTSWKVTAHWQPLYDAAIAGSRAATFTPGPQKPVKMVRMKAGTAVMKTGTMVKYMTMCPKFSQHLKGIVR